MWGIWISCAMWAATPLWSPEGERVVRTIEADGSRWVLTVEAAFDADAVASRIRERLENAQVLRDGQRLWVEGVSRRALQQALSNEALKAAPDDVDELLASLREPGRSEDGSGSSVRAVREGRKAELPEAEGPVLTARVRGLERHRFPLVLVRVELEEVPEDGPWRPGQQIVVLPRVKSHRGLVDPNDKLSKLNVGAWYAKAADRVTLVLEPRPEGQKVWVARRFERLP